jgi:hypothetical protein
MSISRGGEGWNVQITVFHVIGGGGTGDETASTSAIMVPHPQMNPNQSWDTFDAGVLRP